MTSVPSASGEEDRSNRFSVGMNDPRVGIEVNRARDLPNKTEAEIATLEGEHSEDLPVAMSRRSKPVSELNAFRASGNRIAAVDDQPDPGRGRAERKRRKNSLTDRGEAVKPRATGERSRIGVVIIRALSV